MRNCLELLYHVSERTRVSLEAVAVTFKEPVAGQGERGPHKVVDPVLISVTREAEGKQAAAERSTRLYASPITQALL